MTYIFMRKYTPVTLNDGRLTFDPLTQVEVLKLINIYESYVMLCNMEEFLGENALLSPKTPQNARATFDPVSQTNQYVDSYNSCLMTRIMKKKSAYYEDEAYGTCWNYHFPSFLAKRQAQF